MAASGTARIRSASLRTGVALVLALALVIVQSLGLLHGVAHFGHAHDGDRDAQAQAFASPLPGALQALFAGHDDDSDCDLFDQASHADLAGACGPDSALAAARLEAPGAHAAWHVAAQAQGFLARAPPTVS